MENKKSNEFDAFFLELLSKEMNEDQQILISSFAGTGVTDDGDANAIYVCGNNIGNCQSDNDACNSGNCVAGCSCKS